MEKQMKNSMPTGDIRLEMQEITRLWGGEEKQDVIADAITYSGDGTFLTILCC